MTERRKYHIIIWLPIAFFFWFLNFIYHLDFSELITIYYKTPIGRIMPQQHIFYVEIFISVLLFIYLTREFIRGNNRLNSVLWWLIILVGILNANNYLITSPVETIHYLQYGLLAYLFAFSLDPDKSRSVILEVLMIVSILSIIDELNQYINLTPVRSTYFDFNDLVLNNIGAISGLLIHYGFLKVDRHLINKFPLLKISLVAFYLLAIILIIHGFYSKSIIYSPDNFIDPGGIELSEKGKIFYLQRLPEVYGTWNPTFSNGIYYIMKPVEGVVIIMLSILSFSSIKWLDVQTNNQT